MRGKNTIDGKNGNATSFKGTFTGGEDLFYLKPYSMHTIKKATGLTASSAIRGAAHRFKNTTRYKARSFTSGGSTNCETALLFMNFSVMISAQNE